MCDCIALLLTAGKLDHGEFWIIAGQSMKKCYRRKHRLTNCTVDATTCNQLGVDVEGGEKWSQRPHGFRAEAASAFYIECHGDEEEDSEANDLQGQASDKNLSASHHGFDIIVVAL